MTTKSTNEYMAAYMRRRYADLKAKRLCIRCSKKLQTEEGVRCRECAKDQHRMVNRWKEAQKINGNSIIKGVDND